MDPAAEHELHLFRAADVQVVRAQRLKEPAGVAGLAEHEGARDLDLTHRDVPPIAAGPVGGGQRQRQPDPPPLAEPRDSARPEPVAEPLQPARVVGAGEPVVQLGEPDPGRVGGALGVLVAVEPLRILTCYLPRVVGGRSW